MLVWQKELFLRNCTGRILKLYKIRSKYGLRKGQRAADTQSRALLSENLERFYSQGPADSLFDLTQGVLLSECSK